MSSKRKFSRAQAARSKPARPAGADAPGKSPAGNKSRAELRRELAAERFKKPGSAELWTALLGWEASRLERIWLIQALNDAAQKSEGPGAVERDVRARAPALAAKLVDSDLEKAVELWRSSGDDYLPGEPSAKWHYLAALSGRLGLGEPSAEELQDDWEAWTSLRIAAPLRNALMTTLGQSEQAAVALHGMTHSENVAAIVNVVRFTWSALAYGDARAFEKVRQWSDEWLAFAASHKPR